MAPIPDSARTVIESGRLAHLVTLEPDGSPQVTCVWVGLDGDEIVSGHLGRWRKVANIERDPRVALSIEAPGANDIGMDHYLVVHGRARVSQGGGADMLQRLAGVYLGPGIPFPPMPDPPPGCVVHITVDRLGGLGPWAG